MAQPATGWAAGAGPRLHHRAWTGPSDLTRAPMLLLHGLASGSRIWDLTAPRLARQRRVVALDQRGHGLSDKPDSGYDFATIVADDRAVMEEMALRRPIVVGHSWGAGVALALAAWRPEAVSGLALVDGGLTSLRDRPGATWEQVARDLAPPDYAGTPREVFIERLRTGSQAAMWRPELEEIILNIVELGADGAVGPRLSRANHLRILRAMWETPLTELFELVRCPVLAVMAEPAAGDERAAAMLERKRAGAARATERLRHAAWVEVRWLADTVHDVPLHRPDELVELLERLAARVDGARSSD